MTHFMQNYLSVSPGQGRLQLSRSVFTLLLPLYLVSPHFPHWLHHTSQYNTSHDTTCYLLLSPVRGEDGRMREGMRERVREMVREMVRVR